VVLFAAIKKMSRAFQKKKKGKKKKENNQNNSRLIKCAVVDNSPASSGSSSRIEFNFCTVIVILCSLAALLAVPSPASVILLGLGLVSALLMKCMSVDCRKGASWSGANTSKADDNGTIGVRVGEVRE
jgi:hypothetical protein